jgi:hypothetical protein
VLFKGKFKDRSNLKSQFQKINGPFRAKLQQLFDDDIGRLKYFPPTGRILIESYDEAMERFKLKMERPYRFIANPERETQQLFYIF